MDFSIGDKVSLRIVLPFLRTADSMPILRPPDLVSTDEIGEIVGIRTADNVEVLFREGKFIISTEHLLKVPSSPDKNYG